jgi:hypothetical protein
MAGKAKCDQCNLIALVFSCNVNILLSGLALKAVSFALPNCLLKF